MPLRSRISVVAASLLLASALGCSGVAKPPRGAPRGGSGGDGEDPARPGGSGGGAASARDAAAEKPRADDAGVVKDAGPPRDGQPDAGLPTRLVATSAAGYVVVHRFDLATGLVHDPQLITTGGTPHSSAVHPTAPWAYVADRSKPGRILTLAVDGRSPVIAREIPSGADDPIDITVDPSGRWAFVAHAGGSLWAFPIDTTGQLGEGKALPSCNGPGGARLVGDVLLVPCRFNHVVRGIPFDPENGVIGTPTIVMSLVGGDRPGQVAVRGERLVVLAEHGRVLVGGVLASGMVTEVARASTIPNGVTRSSLSTRLALHPSADVAYVTSAGDFTEADNISVFTIDRVGAPTLAHHVSAAPDPGPIAVSPDGRWLILGSSPVADLRSYAVDDAGAVVLEHVIALIDSPTSIAFWPP